jgi:hypothetical protein
VIKQGVSDERFTRDMEKSLENIDWKALREKIASERGMHKCKKLKLVLDK